MSSKKRIGMYLSVMDDASLVQELEQYADTGRRGTKGDLLRNYALLGYQQALSVCAEITNEQVLTQALAKLFAPNEAPPDFRSAAKFIMTRSNKAGNVQQGARHGVSQTPPAEGGDVARTGGSRSRT